MSKETSKFFRLLHFLTVPSIDLYEPQINVLSPHTCIGKTEYVPLSILNRTILDKKPQSSSSKPPEKPSSAPANQQLPVDSIQNRKRKANNDADSKGKDDMGG